MHNVAQSLSSRQAEIANLVAIGKSTREISEALVLSPRTVEHHIDAIFNKLGVRSRVELTAALVGEARNLSAAWGASAAKTNLPSQRTNLIGREAEIEDILRLLGAGRIVTVTGAGGVGKTRTALAVGEGLLERAPAGVWFVDLAPLAHGSSVAGAIARALGVEESPKRPLLETLLAYLQTQSLLLILDNCEHVIADARKIASALLAGCRQVRILATSREPLRIFEEHVYRIPSLGLPSPHNARRLSAVAANEYAAIALFADRARAACDTFALTDENVATVADICRRLDGVPLAIELAAVRVGSWPLDSIAKRLDQRFTLLIGGDRAAPTRHQTLRALIDWSYDRLSPQEQHVLRSVSVFAGTWTLEAASALLDAGTNDSERTAALVSSLVDKSLVTIEHAGDTLQYRLLESIRAYASEKSTYER